MGYPIPNDNSYVADFITHCYSMLTSKLMPWTSGDYFPWTLRVQDVLIQIQFLWQQSGLEEQENELTVSKLSQTLYLKDTAIESTVVIASGLAGSNCLPSSGSVLINGNEERHDAIRFHSTITWRRIPMRALSFYHSSHEWCTRGPYVAFLKNQGPSQYKYRLSQVRPSYL